MSTRWVCHVMAGIAVECAAAGAFAITVLVPTDQPTVQGAVNAAGAGGTVIINSNAIFNETVTVTQSLTIHGGVGFTPTIRGTGTCGVIFTCALYFEPNSSAPQMLVVTDVRLLPKSGGGAPGVVRILNRGATEASMILSHFTIENPEGFGFSAIEIHRLSCSSGFNNVSIQSGSINIAGSNENSAGLGGFQMDSGGTLTVSDVDLSISGASADAFNIVGTPDCGQINFGLYDSNIRVSAPSDLSASLGRVLLGVLATLERNSFQMISEGEEGGIGGIFLGGGSGQSYESSMDLNANTFFGSGPNDGPAVHVSASSNGSAVLTATNNVLHNMHSGFRLGQNLGNPAGSVAARLANNTVDGAFFDAISLHSADGSILDVRAQNNLLTHSGGLGISLTSEPGGSLEVTNDYNGFFANAAGNVDAALTVGPHDVVGDPIYVDRGDTDLRLGIGSPMINKGDAPFFLPATDANGAMRIQGGIVDIGAFEGAFVVTGPTNTPSATPTATGTSTRTLTGTATNTRMPTPTASHTRTATVTVTHTVSRTPTGSATASSSATRVRTATPTASLTAPTEIPPSPTSTRTTAAGSPTPSVTASPVTTVTTTATATVGAGQCIGDCDGSNTVSVNELVLGVNIALARAALTACPPFDHNDSQGVEVNELVAAVNRALQGCNQLAAIRQ